MADLPPVGSRVRVRDGACSAGDRALGGATGTVAELSDKECERARDERGLRRDPKRERYDSTAIVWVAIDGDESFLDGRVYPTGFWPEALEVE